MRRLLVCAAALGLSLMGTAYAVACEGSKILYEDSFDGNKLTGQWNNTNGRPSVDGGQLVFTPSAGKSNSIFAAFYLHDIDYCATVDLTDSTDAAGSYAGLAFWATDLNNLYTFQITFDGHATVYQYKAEKWVQLINDTPASSIKQGTDAINELRVVTKGNRAIFYINGTEFGRINGQSPAGGQHIGFVVESPSSGPATFRMDDVLVTVPQ